MDGNDGQLCRDNDDKTGHSTNKNSNEEKPIYQTLYQQKEAEKNPSGYTREQVLNFIKMGTIIPGSPPKIPVHSSIAWKKGMRYLYIKDAESNKTKELKNWFYCSKCDWLSNCILGNGTGTVGKHHKTHSVEPPYMFSREQLANLLATCSSFGCENGGVEASFFNQILPDPKQW